MIEETTQGYTPDAAFVSALVGQELFGTPLAKFSLSRKEAAQRMGCQAPACFKQDTYEQFTRTLTYDGIHRDVMCILWLCTLPDKITSIEDFKAGAFTPDIAFRRSDDALMAARAWAEGNGVANMASKEYEAAWKVFLNIVFAIDASLFEVTEDSAGRPSKDPPDPKAKPGLPRSRSSSRKSRSKAGKL